jgi:hypothetical protein
MYTYNKGFLLIFALSLRRTVALSFAALRRIPFLHRRSWYSIPVACLIRRSSIVRHRGAFESTEDVELALSACARRTLLLPHTTHLLKLRLEVAHGLVHEELLKRPLLDIACLVFLQVVDILNSAREYRALGLLARPVRHDAPELIDPLIDIPAPSALNFFLLGVLANVGKFTMEELT